MRKPMVMFSKPQYDSGYLRKGRSSSNNLRTFMRSKPLFHFTGLAAALALAVPSVAAAQQSPDPDSPAGVEYALPLDRARDLAREKKQQSKGREGNRRQQGGKGAARLFGDGITKSVSNTGGAGSDQANADGVPGGASSAGNGSGGSDSGGSGSKGSGSNGSGTDGENGSKARAGENGENGVADRTAASVADGGSQTGLLLGVVAGVLLLGGLLGLGLRLGFGRNDS
jgi:hypothetical protein